jgi:hypothetical protein
MKQISKYQHKFFIAMNAWIMCSCGLQQNAALYENTHILEEYAAFMSLQQRNFRVLNKDCFILDYLFVISRSPDQVKLSLSLCPHHNHFNPKDGGSMFLQNTGIHLQYYKYIVSLPRTPQSEIW